VLRYRDRILAHNTETAHDNQVLMDDIYAFCIICLALRDWLEREKAATKDDLRVFFERSVPLQVCRDIVNSTAIRARAASQSAGNTKRPRLSSSNRETDGKTWSNCPNWSSHALPIGKASSKRGRLKA
jgi:hypothetical protein